MAWARKCECLGWSQNMVAPDALFGLLLGMCVLSMSIVISALLLFFSQKTPKMYPKVAQNITSSCPDAKYTDDALICLSWNIRIPFCSHCVVWSKGDIFLFAGSGLTPLSTGLAEARKSTNICPGTQAEAVPFGHLRLIPNNADNKRTVTA